jgi:hypothetical protein
MGRQKNQACPSVYPPKPIIVFEGVWFFLVPLQANGVVVSRLAHGRFLADPFHFILTFESVYSTLATASFNELQKGIPRKRSSTGTNSHSADP